MGVKRVKHVRKVLTILDYFLVEFELISSTEVKSAYYKKMGGKFLKNLRKMTKFRRTIGEKLRKFLGNFTLNVENDC